MESIAGHDTSLLFLKAKIFHKNLTCYKHLERVKTRTEILGNTRNKMTSSLPVANKLYYSCSNFVDNLVFF